MACISQMYENSTENDTNINFDIKSYIEVSGMEKIASFYRENRRYNTYLSFSSSETITVSIGRVKCTFNGLSISTYKYPDEEPVIDVEKDCIPSLIVHIDGAERPVNTISQKTIESFISDLVLKRRIGHQVNLTTLPSPSITPLMNYIISFLAMSSRRENRVFDIESLLVKLSRSKEKDRQFLESEITYKGINKKSFTRFWTKDETASWQEIAQKALSLGITSIKSYISQPQHGLDI